jgi:xylulokinase
MAYFLGIDIGSSSVKVTLFNGENGQVVASNHAPQTEAPIQSPQPGWAEQNPEDWWKYMKTALHQVLSSSNVSSEEIKAIGITYQMHGLVLVDKDLQVLRPAIIWCDSRAIPYGNKAFDTLGHEYCLQHLLNSPGNFTAAKLAWVKENEPEIFDHIYKYMLPGDYIAMRMTGEVRTTISGLSEGMFWDYTNSCISDDLMTFFGFSKEIAAELVPTFGEQGRLTASIADELGLKAGTPVCYRAGDQPNNAFSLNVLNPGEIAATAGTSGVVYGISDQIQSDPKSRINMFAHVNHTAAQPRIGVMHCTNGVGIQNAWMKRLVAPDKSYDQFNEMAAIVPVGSEGVTILPFGNGAERILENRIIDASIHGINFNHHNANTLARATQEGVAFSFCYGMSIMQSVAMDVKVIRAGMANMFLSPVFRTTLASVTNAVIELYNTDGSIGAAVGAALGSDFYKTPQEAFGFLRKIEVVEPDRNHHNQYLEAYRRWVETLQRTLQ